MNTFDEFDEQTDFSFLSLEESAPVAVTPKKSRSVQTDKITIGVSLVGAFSDETRAKIRAARTGTVRSAETKSKMSASLSGRVFTEEGKANLSEARKAWWATKGRNITFSRPAQQSISTPAGIFSSRTAASKHYGVSNTMVSRWVKSNPQQFYYITKD